jgi:rhomboid-like protein
MSSLRLLLKPTLFTVGIGGTCFCAAAVAQFENRQPRFSRHRPPQIIVQDWIIRQQRRTDDLHGQFLELRRKINTWRNQLSTGHKVAFTTIAANLVVLGAWRVPRLRSVMNKYFLSHVNTSKLAISPMILTCFSHSSPLHFTFNMFALYSFSNIATALLGPEQLIALFFTAGTISSLTSMTFRLATRRFIPSLGASGAILGVVAYVCRCRPETNLLLFFIPIAAGHAIKGLMLFDTVGMLARWSFIDHAGHLGGSCFGVWYAMHGEKLFYKYRKPIVDEWIRFRTKFTD